MARLRSERLDELPDILTVAELARFLRVGRNEAYQMVRDGHLFASRVGHRILVPKVSLERFLAGEPVLAKAAREERIEPGRLEPIRQR